MRNYSWIKIPIYVYCTFSYWKGDERDEMCFHSDWNRWKNRRLFAFSGSVKNSVTIVIPRYDVSHYAVLNTSSIQFASVFSLHKSYPHVASWVSRVSHHHGGCLSGVGLYFMAFLSLPFMFGRVTWPIGKHLFLTREDYKTVVKLGLHVLLVLILFRWLN